MVMAPIRVNPTPRGTASGPADDDNGYCAQFISGTADHPATLERLGRSRNSAEAAYHKPRLRQSVGCDSLAAFVPPTA
jgi:hypothetical protein